VVSYFELIVHCGQLILRKVSESMQVYIDCLIVATCWYRRRYAAVVMYCVGIGDVSEDYIS